MEELVKPKVKAITFNHLLVTAEKPKLSSLIIPDEKQTQYVNEVQTVVVKGPFVSEESQIEVGSKVMLDPTRLKAIRLWFNKFTGELMPQSAKDKELEEQGIDYMLIHDRDVIAVLE